MTRALPWVGGLGLLLFLGSAAWLGRLEQEPPARADLILEGGIPATLYLPYGEGPETFVLKPPREERPPGVVLMHGFASDRLGMSTLARRLARGGYAVIAFDARGHGENRNAFQGGWARSDTFFADYAAAVDFLRGTPLVDGSRIAVMGHSMGAGASLDFATRDSGIDATVLISGGWALHGPLRPPNALFLYASGDPERVKRRSGEIASQLAGESVETGRSYGDPARGSAVRVVEIGGVDHATIVWSRDAAREILRWLDGVFGRGPEAPVASDPRLLAALLCALSLLLVVPGLGLVVGRLAPRVEEPSGDGGVRGIASLAAALVAVMPLLAVATPAAVLSIEVGDVVVSQLALAGIALLAWLALRGDLPPREALRRPGRVLGAAALGSVGIYVLLLPIGAVVHRVTLTPERAGVFALAALALLPFSVAFQWLLRRGAPARASLFSVLGRALVLTILVLGVAAGLLSPVVILMLPSLLLVFALFELLAGAIYAASRNLAVISLIDAAWLALIVAAVMPIRI